MPPENPVFNSNSLVDPAKAKPNHRSLVIDTVREAPGTPKLNDTHPVPPKEPLVSKATNLDQVEPNNPGKVKPQTEIPPVPVEVPQNIDQIAGVRENSSFEVRSNDEKAGWLTLEKSVSPSSRQEIPGTREKDAGLSFVKVFRQMYSGSSPGPQASTAPATVKVTIGRIDVRAIQRPAATRETPRSKPDLSLDDFLKKKNAGK